MIRTKSVMPTDWPYALADFVLLLAPDDLPEEFSLFAWSRVVNRDGWLANLQGQILRGADAHEVIIGDTAKEILSLAKLLLNQE